MPQGVLVGLISGGGGGGVKRSDWLSIKTQTGDLSSQEFQRVPYSTWTGGFFCPIYQQFAMSCLT